MLDRFERMLDILQETLEGVHAGTVPEAKQKDVCNVAATLTSALVAQNVHHQNINKRAEVILKIHTQMGVNASEALPALLGYKKKDEDEEE